MSIILTTSNPRRGAISIELSVQGALPADIARQLPFARALALNRTVQEGVAVARLEAAKRFRVRGDQGRRFFDQSFQVTQFATKNEPAVAYGISQALRQSSSIFLIDHEDGATRTASGRNKFPYLPAIGSSLRPSIGDILPRWASPKNLGLLDSRGIDGGTVSGRDRTGKRAGSTRGLRARENRKAFIIRREDGTPLGIFRRVPLAGQRVSATREGGRKLRLGERRRRGTGQSTLELLYATPKVVTIAPRLEFRRTAEHVMISRIEANFEGMLAYAIDQARQASNAQFAQSDAALIAQFTRRGR